MRLTEQRYPMLASGWLAALILLILCAVTSPASAAPITWQTPQTETGNISDVLTNGTFVDSTTAYGASDVVVNGVTFHHEVAFTGGSTVSFAGSNIQITNYNGWGNTGWASYGGMPPAPNTYDSQYALITQTPTYNTSQYTVALNNLTIGAHYEVQIFGGWWDHDWYNTYSDAPVDGSNTTGYVHMGAYSVAPNPSFVVGTFTANATTQNIVASYGLSNNFMFYSMQLRAVPEPPTAAIALALLAALGLFRGGRRSASQTGR